MTGTAGTGRAIRVAAGLATLAVTGSTVHREVVGPVEGAVFRSVNRLPDRLYRSAWVVMQAGNVLAAPAAGAVALAAGRPRLAARLAVTGALTWTSAKLLKRAYRRPRPAQLVTGVRCRGHEPSGLGYVSGHAGIAAGLAVAVLPALRGPARVLVAGVVAVVGPCRVYVGAHLPLDIVGGAALGVISDALVAAALDRVAAVPVSPASAASPWGRRAARDSAGRSRSTAAG
ncbi:MAG TPA: phosphatase PAP2 family protein [Jatrophihabitans sp.]|jgi:undecaprenyl-diphosphatase